MNELVKIAIHAALQAGKAILEIYKTSFDVEYKDDHSPLTLADKHSHQIIFESLESTGLPILSEEGARMEYKFRKHWKHFWLVDPLDGTKEFVKKNGDFTVNIALIDYNMPEMGVIYVPVTDELYYGENQSGAFKVEKASTFNKMEKLLNAALPLPLKNESPMVVASRSHLNKETEEFIKQLKHRNSATEIRSRGSSLKICMVAENQKAVYPRFAPTYEWDTAAGHAILKAAGGKIILASDTSSELTYNKESLLNPSFIALFKSK